MAHPAHQVVAAEAYDHGVVVFGEAVDAAPDHDGVAAALFVQALPEGRARLGDFGRVRLDLAELAHVIEQQTMVKVAVVQTVGQRPADLVTTTPQQASNGHHWHVSLRAAMRTSFLPTPAVLHSTTGRRTPAALFRGCGRPARASWPDL